MKLSRLIFHDIHVYHQSSCTGCCCCCTGCCCSTSSNPKDLSWLMKSLTVFGALPTKQDNSVQRQFILCELCFMYDHARTATGWMAIKGSLHFSYINCFIKESMLYTVVGILPSFGPVSCSEWSLTGCLKASVIMSYIGVWIYMGVRTVLVYSSRTL